MEASSSLFFNYLEHPGLVDNGRHVLYNHSGNDAHLLLACGQLVKVITKYQLSQTLTVIGPRNMERSANKDTVASFLEHDAPESMSPLTNMGGNISGINEDISDLMSDHESTATSGAGSSSHIEVGGYPIVRLLARDWLKDQVLVLWALWGNEGVARFRCLSWESVANILSKELRFNLMAARDIGLQEFRVEEDGHVFYEVPKPSIKQYVRL